MTTPTDPFTPSSPWPDPPGTPGPGTTPAAVPAELHDRLCPGRTATWHDPARGLADCVLCGAVVTAEQQGWAA